MSKRNSAEAKRAARERLRAEREKQAKRERIRRQLTVAGAVVVVLAIAGGIGHTLPYLIPDFWTATAVAGVVVVIELAIIAWIQWRYMDTPPVSAAAKVMLGGGLVLATGILIGNS